MASFASVADQLRASTAAAEATVSASGVKGALTSGTDRARGALSSLVGEGPFRTNLLGGAGRGSDRRSAPGVPSDGTRCEECGEEFGLMRRRTTCSSCDRFVCPGCMGRNPLAAMAGISCFCGHVCPRCRSQNAQTGEFESCRAEMESGAGVSIAIPKKASSGGFFGMSGSSSAPPRRLPAWLSMDCEKGELCWASLEQKQGRPAEEGRIPVYEILAVRNTGVLLELSVKEHTQPIMLEFGTGEERSAWERYVDLAVQVLTPESERADLDAARASHRDREIEERRSLNEERKKRLQEGLGMRFTAEAMMNRSGGGG